MADPTQQMQQMLTNAEANFGSLNSAGQQLAAALLQAAKAGNSQTNAATATAQSLAVLQARSTAVSNGISTIGGAFTGLVGQATSLAAGIYGADKAFSSVIPTLDALGSIVTKFTTGIGQLGSGFSLFGFSLGRASDAAATFANTGIEAIQGILKFQIEAAQKVADNYVAVAKAGALFGGSITRMGQVAADARVPIQTLVKVITSNAESLSKLGLGQEKGAAVVTAYTRKIFDANNALRILYGNFDELSIGVADYLASQAQLGVSSTKDYEQTKAAAIDYLYRQKELTAITGKNADLLKKEEEARRNQLDYNLKLGRLGDDARKNVTEGMAIAGKIFGSEGAKYAEEYFATGGKVITKSSQAYQATNQVAAESIAGMIGAVDQSREGFRTFTGSLLKDAAPALEAFGRDQEQFAEINRAANNSILGVQVATGSAIMANLSFINNLPTLFEEIEAARAKMTTQPLDAASKAFATAQESMLQNQILIDKTVLKNMESMGDTIKLLNQVQAGFISLQGLANDTLTKIIESGFSSTKDIDNFIKELSNRISNPPGTPGATPAPAAGATTPVAPAAGRIILPEGLSLSSAATAETEIVARLQSEVDGLNRDIVAMKTTSETAPDYTKVFAEMVTGIRDNSDRLDRIRDALA